MFYADLHVHSKYSLATSRDCDLEHLALWAGRKGITVVGAGDFTHPAWLEEIHKILIPTEPGLYRLKPRFVGCVKHTNYTTGYIKEIQNAGPGAFHAPYFMLQTEVSTVYKKDGRTRKVHHIVYAPDFACARRFIKKINRFGKLGSDGRPTLGLDSRELLEMVLESGEGCYLIPAHIWTPWFGVLGSKSGFDSIEECYGDLASEIFALETGLSSDPAMNWRLSSLDRFALVSNSDAHSPAKLGREACVFDVKPDYFSMFRALRTGKGYRGTLEFFPEEGKYFNDGHRKCGVCLTPKETRRLKGQCPVCGKPLTLGVMHRVEKLADRQKPPDPLSRRAAPFRSLIPLVEVLAEIYKVGPQSKFIGQKYDELLAELGPELFILEQTAIEDISQKGSSLLAEAISRMREGRVIRHPGFDGQYGTIRLFSDDELEDGDKDK